MDTPNNARSEAKYTEQFRNFNLRRRQFKNDLVRFANADPGGFVALVEAITDGCIPSAFSILRRWGIQPNGPTSFSCDTVQFRHMPERSDEDQYEGLSDTAVMLLNVQSYLLALVSLGGQDTTKISVGSDLLWTGHGSVIGLCSWVCGEETHDGKPGPKGSLS